MTEANNHNVKNLLNKHESDMWRCVRCSLCKFPPLAQIWSAKFSSACCSMDFGVFHAWSGGGKIAMAFSLQKNRISEITDEMRDAILQCTLCGACDVACKGNTNIEVLDILYDLRRFLVETKGPHPSHEKYINYAIKSHNVYDEDHQKRQEWINNSKAKSDPSSKTLFFTGCTSAYRQQSIVKASVEILNSTGYTFQLSKDEHCCGSPIYRAGMPHKAKKFFEYNLELFEKLGIEEVITACPGCYSMLKSEYPKLLDEKHYNIWEFIKIRHMTEVIEDLFKQKRIELTDKPKDKIIVSYHDPCHLGREGEPFVPDWKGIKRKIFNQVIILDPPKKFKYGKEGIYDPPRNILQNLKNHIEFVEMYRIQEYAYCCGAGAGVKSAFPEMALNSASNRLDEAEEILNQKFKELYKNNLPSNESDYKILVSSCPFCKTNFEDAIKLTGKKIKYMDINELLLERMKSG
jgi:Fe-S oxidoreductase